MDFMTFLQSVTSGITANVLYEKIKSFLSDNNSPDLKQLKEIILLVLSEKTNKSTGFRIKNCENVTVKNNYSSGFDIAYDFSNNKGGEISDNIGISKADLIIEYLKNNNFKTS